MAHDTHDSGHSSTSHADHAAMGEVHEHPNWGTYKWIALILTVLAIVGMALLFTQSNFFHGGGDWAGFLFLALRCSVLMMVLIQVLWPMVPRAGRGQIPRHCWFRPGNSCR